MNEELKRISGEYMRALSQIYDLDSRVMENFEKNDNLLFSTLVPFLEDAIFVDLHAYVDSLRLCSAIERQTGGRVYYGFSWGNNMVLLFVDGNSENWEKDFPRKGEPLRVAVGKKSGKFVITEALPVSHRSVLVFKTGGTSLS